MSKKTIFAVLAILVLILSACAGATQAPVEDMGEEPVSEEPMDEEPMAEEPMEGAYSQAPMLDDMDLPPIEERLPDNPMVIGPGDYMTEANLPDWTPGKYGGTLRSSHAVANWNPDIFVMMNEPFLMAPKIGDQDIVCAVCESFEVSADNSQFTFTLRKGLKWSDGEPVTTEDVRFAWEDIRNNENIFPNGVPNRFRTGYAAKGTPGELEIIDDYTFTVTFDGPYGAFLRNLTIEGWNGYTEFIEPAHYLKQFHGDYVSLDELRPLLDEQNLEDEWWQVFSQHRCQNWDMTNPRCAGYPALNPWIGVDTGNPNTMRFERNPYYFKVDTTGQQLPYIDVLTSQQVNDMEMVTLKIANGEVDFQRESTALVNIPLYKENEEKAGFRVQLLDMHVDSSGLRLNRTFEDDNWQSVVNDIRFHQAISLAIDRQELIDTIYYGYASLPLNTVGEEFSQYDVDKANGLLDDMGLTERDADGFRTYADGSTIEILLETGGQAPDLVPVADLTAQYLADIGLSVTVKPIDSSLFSERYNANEIQASVMWSHDIGWSNDVSSGSINRAGRLWQIWLDTGGSEGEEPPAWAMEAVDRDQKKWQAVPGTDEYNALVEEGFLWCQENLPYINYVEGVKYPLIVNKNLKNVPVNGYAIGANFSVVQMYFDTP